MSPAIRTHKRGGSDALPEISVSEDYLVVFELYRLGSITRSTHTLIRPNQDGLKVLFEKQIPGVVRWMCRHVNVILIMLTFLSFWLFFHMIYIYIYIVSPVSNYNGALFRCTSVNVNIDM